MSFRVRHLSILLVSFLFSFHFLSLTWAHSHLSEGTEQRQATTIEELVDQWNTLSQFEKELNRDTTEPPSVLTARSLQLGWIRGAQLATAYLINIRLLPALKKEFIPSDAPTNETQPRAQTKRLSYLQRLARHTLSDPAGHRSWTKVEWAGEAIAASVVYHLALKTQPHEQALSKAADISPDLWRKYQHNTNKPNMDPLVPYKPLRLYGATALLSSILPALIDYALALSRSHEPFREASDKIQSLYLSIPLLAIPALFIAYDWKNEGRLTRDAEVLYRDLWHSLSENWSLHMLSGFLSAGGWDSPEQFFSETSTTPVPPFLVESPRHRADQFFGRVLSQFDSLSEEVRDLNSAIDLCQSLLEDTAS